MVSRLTVKVVPGSSRATVVGWLGEVLKVRVTEPPEKGKANKAVIAVLADVLGLPASQFRIRTGHASRTKVVEVQGLSEAEIRARVAK